MLLAAVKLEASDFSASLNVCIDNGIVVNTALVERAKAKVTGMFAEIGVQLLWSKGADCRRHAPDSILIHMDDKVPARFQAGVMAYALPYGNSETSIHVFYQRVLEGHPPAVASGLLGHVMAHEITHVLQGVARHSETGLMKPNWAMSDYCRMRAGSLPFTAEDVMLVHLGIEARDAKTLRATR